VKKRARVRVFEHDTIPGSESILCCSPRGAVALTGVVVAAAAAVVRGGGGGGRVL
jgi:hypothetical protein